VRVVSSINLFTAHVGAALPAWGDICSEGNRRCADRPGKGPGRRAEARVGPGRKRRVCSGGRELRRCPLRRVIEKSGENWTGILGVFGQLLEKCRPGWRMLTHCQSPWNRPAPWRAGLQERGRRKRIGCGAALTCRPTREDLTP